MNGKQVHDPVTREDWQIAVDAAEGAIHLDSARKYGLVAGGPEVDVTRCLELLRRGRAIGVTPSQGAVTRFVRTSMAAQDERPRGKKLRAVRP